MTSVASVQNDPLLSRKEAARYLSDLGLEMARKHWRVNFMKGRGRSARMSATAPCIAKAISINTSPSRFQRRAGHRASRASRVRCRRSHASSLRLGARIYKSVQ